MTVRAKRMRCSFLVAGRVRLFPRVHFMLTSDCAATMPLPPPRLSTMTVWPSVAVRCCAMMRAAKSLAPPAAAVTRRTGFVG